MQKEDVEYSTNKHQPYFEFMRGQERFVIGMDDILTCLAIAQKTGEIPPVAIADNTNPSTTYRFWNEVKEKFGVDIIDIEVDMG